MLRRTPVRGLTVGLSTTFRCTRKRIDHVQFRLIASCRIAARSGVGVVSGHPLGMQFKAGAGAGSGQEASGGNRTVAAGGFCAPEWEHDDDGGTTADVPVDDRGADE